MEDFTLDHKVHKNQQSELYFTVSGKEDYTDDDGMPRVSDAKNKHIYAKKIHRDDGSIRYSVKLSTNGKLYNPISMYSQDDSPKFLERVCREDRFKNVSYKIFDMYLNFLRTKNPAWLYNAEREAE